VEELKSSKRSQSDQANRKTKVVHSGEFHRANTDSLKKCLSLDGLEMSSNTSESLKSSSGPKGRKKSRPLLERRDPVMFKVSILIPFYLFMLLLRCCCCCCCCC
jgi:hypothetical protein